MDPNRAEHGFDVQRSLRSVCERSARPTTDSPPGRRHLYARFGDVAVCPGLLAYALAHGDCWPVVGDVLFADNDLRFDDAAQTPDYLWDRGLRSRHRVREQYRDLVGRVVHRTSVLGRGFLGLPRPRLQ